MNRWNALLVMFLVVGCASKKGSLELEDVTNADFKQKSPAAYDQQKDYFKNVELAQAGALKDESLYRLKHFDGSVDSKDVITRIIYKCHQGEFEEAFELVEQNTDSHKNDPSFWNQVGTCYLLKGSRRKALLFYNKALEFKPGFAPALNNIGVMYRKEGDDQKAEVAFARAIQSANFAKTPRFNLAQLYLDYGLFKEALTHLRVLEDSNDVDVLAGLGSAYLMSGEYERSAAYFDKIDEDFFEKPYIGINAALAFYKIGRVERAKEILDDIDQDQLGPYKRYFTESAKKVGL